MDAFAEQRRPGRRQGPMLQPWERELADLLHELCPQGLTTEAERAAHGEQLEPVEPVEVAA